MLLFFQVCLHEFGHSFSSLFECVFHVCFMFLGSGFHARVVVFPQEYECFGQNPAPWKIALFFNGFFMFFHVFHVCLMCVFMLASSWLHVMSEWNVISG